MYRRQGSRPSPRKGNAKTQLSEEALQITEKRREAKVEWFFEDLQDLLKLTPKRDVLSSQGTGMQ